MLKISARLRVHEYSAYEPHPHLFTAVIIIWQGRMVILRMLAYRSSKSPDKYVFSVIYTAWRYSSSLCLVTCANHSLVTCVLRNHYNSEEVGHASYLHARSHDIEIAKSPAHRCCSIAAGSPATVSAVRMETKCTRGCPRVM